MKRMHHLLLLITALRILSHHLTQGGGVSSNSRRRFPFIALPTLLRGGDDSTINHDDDERYSRQVYTLGARAHALVRTATVYLDGPLSSGLLYECAKNLALSGIGTIVILTSSDATEQLFHVAKYDDLGQAYQRAAKSERSHHNEDEHEHDDDDTLLLIDYIRRLNPSVNVKLMKRSELESTQNCVLLSIDRPQQSQMLLNKLCRQLNLNFVAAETAGVYGKIFCDFGPSFHVLDADGEVPLVTPLDRVEVVDEETFMVHCIRGEKHDVSKGDYIQFQFSTGELLSPPCVVKTVHGPFQFSVRRNTTADNDTLSIEDYVSNVNQQATSFTRIKLPQLIHFLSMEEALQATEDSNGSLFAPCDLDKSFDKVRRTTLLACFQALPLYLDAHQKYPSRGCEEQFRALLANNNTSETHLVDKFTRCCAAKFTPMQGIIGAIGAQEVLKAVSSLYNPVTQFLLYDCDELLDDSVNNAVHEAVSGQEYILGNKICSKLANKNLFVVGAGAIGCELFKNLAAMGAATMKGRLIITDMDTIEKSNLSRQLLFRDGDIGKFKSQAAEKAVQRFNPSMCIEVHTSKVGDDEHGHFSDSFWANDVGIILNALDNVEARLYMDGQCIANCKPMIDAGTLGSKGNVQVVVPNQSESYGFSSDPPDQAIAVCTLKNFPYAISHTIQWARDLFEGYFERRPKQANDYRLLLELQKTPTVAEKMIRVFGDEAAIQAAEELKEDLKMDASTKTESEIRQNAIQWAATEARRLFSDAIDDLLVQHPADSVDEDGEPFWSGTRRVPRALSFSHDGENTMANENIVGFIRAAGRLRIETLSGKGGQVSKEEAIEAILATQSKVRETDSTLSENVYDKVVACLDATISCTAPLQGMEFEKDDEQNGHVDFITAASNLRALCYGIAPVDAMETRRVAGRIVPAMITTTAFVSALSCIELLKLLQGAPLQQHRNAFVNLALPFFAFTAPLPAEQVSGLRGTMYTEWDRIVIKESRKSAAKGGITLEKLLTKITKKLAMDDATTVAISSVSFGPYMIYTNFLHENDKQLMKQPLWSVIKEAIEGGDDDDDFAGRDASDSSCQQVEALERKGFVDLTVVVDDLENDEEVQLPPVRVKRRLLDTM